MIKREIANRIKYLIRKFPVVSLTGPRQSGKTTLIKNIFPDYKYVSLEDIDVREFAKNDPRGFLKNYRANSIIDEIQRVPELFSYIQSAVDADNKVRYIISGSQSFLLSDNISQTLAGRMAILKLLPFSLSELNEANIYLNDFEDYIFTGFYPRIYDKKIEPDDFYPSYIQTYVERDVRLIKNITNLHDFIRFLKLCAGRVGQLLNYSSLANDCGISVNTAKSWLSVLEASYIVFLLQPYYNNFNKRVTKMPKLYFYDIGLVSSLLGIKSNSQIGSHYLRGNLFENLIIAEIVKRYLNAGKEPNIYFLRNSRGNEIDCVIDNGENFVPIEIKSGLTYSENYFKNIIYWDKSTNNQQQNGFVIYGGDKTMETSVGKLLSWKDLVEINLLISRNY